MLVLCVLAQAADSVPIQSIVKENGYINNLANKKVFLRENSREVPSTPYPVRGGRMEGVPLSWFNQGVGGGGKGYLVLVQLGAGGILVLVWCTLSPGKRPEPIDWLLPPLGKDLGPDTGCPTPHPVNKLKTLPSFVLRWAAMSMKSSAFARNKAQTIFPNFYTNT